MTEIEGGAGARPARRGRRPGGESGATEKFFAAIEAGDEAAVDRVLKRSKKLLGARNPAGLSPVTVAAYHGRAQLAERLAARVSAAGEPGIDAFEAAIVGDVHRLRSLLDAGAEVGAPSLDGFTALHLAAFFGRLAAARLLLDRGADPNAIAENEMRVLPLHSALAGRHRDVASLLLAHGASPNALQQGGYTPLHEAAQSGDEATAELLLLRGADPTRANDEGQTPIDLAEVSGNAALAKVLRESVGQRQGWVEPPPRHAAAAEGQPMPDLRPDLRPDYADEPASPDERPDPSA